MIEGSWVEGRTLRAPASPESDELEPQASAVDR